MPQRRELHLQLQLINLQNLLAQTKNEPRLKGPFPVAVYGDMLAACQSIVDRYVIQCGRGSGMADVLPSFHSMRCATTRQDWDAVRLAEVHAGWAASDHHSADHPR